MRRMVSLFVLAACAACGDKLPLAPPEPASISITPAPINMNLGTWLGLTVLLNDAAGNVINIAKPPALSFASRDPSVVGVDSTGRINAIHTGFAYVVASFKAGSRTLVDSVGVAVAMPVNQSRDRSTYRLP